MELTEQNLIMELGNGEQGMDTLYAGAIGSRLND